MIKLEKNAFRSKVINCYEKYLSLSNEQKIAIGIYYKGHTYLFGNGIDSSYMYDIGSISKTFTAHLILNLINEGKINISDSIDKYLELKDGSYPTIDELLTHSAGYNHLTPIEITFFNLLCHGYSRRNLYENIDKEDVIRCLNKRNKHKKKNKYGYSDFAYAVLALVIEKVTGNTFYEVLNDFIVEKLNLNNTSVILSENRYPLAIKNKKVFPFWKWKPNNPYLASGGITSNIQDMLKYLSLQIESKENYITDAHIVSDYVTSNSKIRICKGWHTYVKSHQLWHVGGVGTFRSSIIINKNSKLGVVILGNTKGVSSGNVHYLTKMIYSELKMKKIKF